MDFFAPDQSVTGRSTESQGLEIPAKTEKRPQAPNQALKGLLRW